MRETRHPDGRLIRQEIPEGDIRRMYQAKSAWRKMSEDQRRVFLLWIKEATYLKVAPPQ